MNRHVKGELKPQSIVSLDAAADRPETLIPTKVLEDLTAESPRLRNHPLRYVLNNELHARPFTALQLPELISHLALPCDELSGAEDHAVLVKLCERYGVTPPQSGLNHFSHDFGVFRLKWERHTEFITYTFFRHVSFDEPFERSALAHVATDWLGQLPGQVIAAVHIAILSSARSAPTVEDLAAHFVGEPIIGSAVSGGAAVAFTDCRIHADGFSRILIHDRHLGEHQAGRLVQRLLEIETYRMMALLALPVAREMQSEIARCERELAEAMATLARSDTNDERTLLDQLLQLAASLEQASAATSYRFRAAQAYHALIETRIEELREERLPGLQTIAEFMERRLLPAMRTCTSTFKRLESVSQRLARASNLLRTRVDIAVQEQNRLVLRSMNRRARLQLVLNEMVEGLSVFAITYYALGVLAYPVKALQPLIGLDPGLVIGAASPVLFVLVWLGLHRLRATLFRQNASEKV
jgi:uncharacterized membrane-anchored protein